MRIRSSRPCRSCRAAPAADPRYLVAGFLIVLMLGVLAIGALAPEARAYSNPPPAEIKEKLYQAAVERNIPPEILYGIAWQESTWRQFDSNGDPLIGYDGIGIGMMQISSYGSYDIERLKTDIDYNIAAGANILMEKWNNTPSIGDDAMNCYENWFYAVWGYNGWVANNPYPYTVWAHIADGRSRWAGIPVTPVPHEWLVNGFGVPIPTPQPAHYWTPPLESYFSWYDGVYSSNWVLVANPASATGSVAAGVSIAGIPQNMAAVPGQYPGVVPPGRSLASWFAGRLGGPVEVDTSRPAIVSQRMLFGDSLEEVAATSEEDLSSHYYWTWYDMQSAGFKNWVLVSNPSGETVRTEILIDGQPLQNKLDPAAPDYDEFYFLIGPGMFVTPTFVGMIGGPVEVRAYADGGDWSNEADRRDIIASQRVLVGGAAFNEAPGISADDLSDSYFWPWYDEIGGRNWILLANPNGTPVGYRIEIGTGGCDDPAPANTACQEGTLAPAGEEGDSIEPRFTGVRNGPVRVTATGGGIIASQRVVFGPSFGEIAGYPESRLAGQYHWTWYDQLSAGMKNWVLVSNPGPGDVTYTLKIAGQVPPGYANRSLAAGQTETPTFPGWMGGPVEVTASGPVIASQRVLYKGYFNEVPGMVLDE